MCVGTLNEHLIKTKYIFFQNFTIKMKEKEEKTLVDKICMYRFLREHTVICCM